MEFQEGERIEFTVTGTVINEAEFFERMAKLPLLDEIGERNHAYVVLDNGVITKIDTTDDELGLPANRAKPQYWPAVDGDVWRDDHGDSWYAKNMDFGSRSGLRLKRYDLLGEVIRSAGWLLNNNTTLKLVIRNDEFI